ncbi:MAG: ATP synthase F1 subunit delta [Thermodesulfobacteriota bacterium]
MKSATSKRFAKALIEVGREDGAYKEYGRELRTALAVFSGTPELYKVLLNPMYRIEERQGLIAKLSDSLKLSRSVSRFLNILVDTKHIKQLDDICSAYSTLEDELSGRLRAVLESPVDIPAELVDEIRKKLSESTGREVIISFSKNPALIGGLVIRLDNTILDGSLKTQLELMKEKILEGVV